MAFALMKSTPALRTLTALRNSSHRTFADKREKKEERVNDIPDEYDAVPTSGISRPLSEILKEINKRVPDSLVRVRTEADGFPVKYIPWFTLFFSLYIDDYLCFYILSGADLGGKGGQVTTLKV